MSQQRQNKMVSENNDFGDTTYTKIFVGGLAWETKRESLERYFEQFGEILEAVVINDKNTGRSKGYGFVTFKDADLARRACQNQYPVIDGRRANCNIASFGAQKNRQAAPQHGKKLGPVSRSPSTMYFRQQIPQYAFPHAAYGYPGYPQDIYAMNYYNVYGGQQFPSSYHTTGPSWSPVIYLNYHPFYAQHGQSGGPNQYPKMIQYPYLSQQYRSFGIISLPTTATTPSLTTTTGASTISVTAANTKSPGTATEKSSSTKLQEQSIPT